MIVNRQTKVRLDRAEVRAFVRRLTAALRLKRQRFNVCFVDDTKIQQLNAQFRAKPKPTDVLSFPWKDGGPSECGSASGSKGQEGRWVDEFSGFLGDIVISAETARRNAASAGNSTRHEMRWLILHGVLHLLGYDHEADHGEMTAVELALRNQLGIDRVTTDKRLKTNQRAKGKRKKINASPNLDVKECS